MRERKLAHSLSDMEVLIIQHLRYDSGLLGETRGLHLDRLKHLGIVTWNGDDDYERVDLTEFGAHILDDLINLGRITK